MRLINITVDNIPMQIPAGQTLQQISDKAHNGAYPPLIAKVDNLLFELHKTIEKDCDISFLDITTDAGFRVYQRSCSFMMIFAAREVLGRDTRVVIEHSINKNYFCEIIKEGFEITDKIVVEIEAKMREIAIRDLPIEKHSFPLHEGIEIARDMSLFDKVDLLGYRTSGIVNFYRIDWLYDYFYGQMAPRTGLLADFALVRQDSGFMLIIPNPRNPAQLSEMKNLQKITKVFRESNNWARILKIDTVGALNRIICDGNSGEVIRVNEALHEKSIAQIADAVAVGGKKIVLVAGPSSSGKTIFSHRLAVSLRVHGLKPHVISLDDYYHELERVPLDKFGKPDFESLYSIDIAQIQADLRALLNGETVNIPKFNFFTGKREYKERYISLSDNDLLVIEGIHGLNDKLSANLDSALVYKVFISALTQLNLDDHNRIPTADTRLVRRLVRDSQFRGFDARRTLAMWPAVGRGERENIFPFQEDADFAFNSALVYEMSILKTFAMPLLFAIGRDEPEYIEASRLLKFLDCFLAIPEREIPNNSLIREFIGGSVFKI